MEDCFGSCNMLWMWKWLQGADQNSPLLQPDGRSAPPHPHSMNSSPDAARSGVGLSVEDVSERLKAFTQLRIEIVSTKKDKVTEAYAQSPRQRRGSGAGVADGMGSERDTAYILHIYGPFVRTENAHDEDVHGLRMFHGTAPNASPRKGKDNGAMVLTDAEALLMDELDPATVVSGVLLHDLNFADQAVLAFLNALLDTFPIVHVGFTRCRVTPSDLSERLKFPPLVYLSFHSCGLTDAHLRAMSARAESCADFFANIAFIGVSGTLTKQGLSDFFSSLEESCDLSDLKELVVPSRLAESLATHRLLERLPAVKVNGHTLSAMRR